MLPASSSPFASLKLAGLLAALLGAPEWVQAAYDPPAGYYATAVGTTGAALKAALHNRIKGHTALSYTPGVWTALEALDQDPNNAANVVLLYSGVSRSKTLRDNGTANDLWWNREHVWALSHGPDTTSTTAGRDVFHLFACDKDVNANRDSWPFDEVSFSPDREAPQSGLGGAWWHPRDADKGVIARALFYMAVRYEAEDSANLELAETAGSTTIGKLSTLLIWHRKFPATEAERKRNHQIYTSYQFNRNPFIDNSLFADQVFSNDTPWGAWKRTLFTASQLADGATSGDAADPDRDGIPNRIEFFLNRRPLTPDLGVDAATVLTVLPPPVTNGLAVLSLSHRQHRYATDLILRYESSTDCVTWTEFTPSASRTVYVDAVTDQITVETPLSAEQRFLRLKVERP